MGLRCCMPVQHRRRGSCAWLERFGPLGALGGTEVLMETPESLLELLVFTWHGWMDGWMPEPTPTLGG